MSDILVLPQNEYLGKNYWQATHPNISKLVTQGVSERKTDYLDLISFEYIRDRTPTRLQEMDFVKVDLRIYDANTYIPCHPTLRVIRFKDVIFAPSIYLCDSPKLLEIHFLKTQGHIQLRNLSLKLIVFETESDKTCFDLQNATADEVRPLREVATANSVQI